MAQMSYDGEAPAPRNSFLSRTSKIKEFSRNNETLNAVEEGRQKVDATKLMTKIKELTPRIDELIATYNLAVSNKLPITEGDWCVKSHSQRIGFFDSGTEEIHYMGLSLAPDEQVYGAGREEFVLCTNGWDTFCTLPHYMDEVMVPAVVYMERFLQEFEGFENRFYHEVDKILEAQEQKIHEHTNLVDDILASAIAKSKEDTPSNSRTIEWGYSL